jgi:hypothetical protein
VAAVVLSVGEGVASVEVTDWGFLKRSIFFGVLDEEIDSEAEEDDEGVAYANAGALGAG